MAILVDNLDQAWTGGEDTSTLAEFLFGLLAVSKPIVDDFQQGDLRRKRVNLSLAVFLRSDIHHVMRSLQPERDKVNYTAIKWDDSELLLRMLNERLRHSLDDSASNQDIWSQLFTESVEGTPVQQFIIGSTLARPRDVIYLVRAAIGEAINRGHDKIEASDLLSAKKAYAQFLFDSILAEDNPRLGRLEHILIEFAGQEPSLTATEVRQLVSEAGVDGNDVGEYVDLLCDINFLGIELRNGSVDFPRDENERRRLQAVSHRIAKAAGTEERYSINPAFKALLQIE